MVYMNAEEDHEEENPVTYHPPEYFDDIDHCTFGREV